MGSSMAKHRKQSKETPYRSSAADHAAVIVKAASFQEGAADSNILLILDQPKRDMLKLSRIIDKIRLIKEKSQSTEATNASPVSAPSPIKSSAVTPSTLPALEDLDRIPPLPLIPIEEDSLS